MQRKLYTWMKLAAFRIVPLKSPMWRVGHTKFHCNGGSFKLRLAVELPHHALGSILSDICLNNCVIILSAHDITHNFNRKEHCRPLLHYSRFLHAVGWFLYASSLSSEGVGRRHWRSSNEGLRPTCKTPYSLSNEKLQLNPFHPPKP
jgi:hypothetical protein